MDIVFDNRKLPSIHSESVRRSRSKANTYSFAEIITQSKKSKRFLIKKKNPQQHSARKELIESAWCIMPLKSSQRILHGVLVKRNPGKHGEGLVPTI